MLKSKKQPVYDGAQLLDGVLAHLNLKNDAALGRVLEVAPPLISKIRNARQMVSSALLIRLQEETNLSIRELRAMMGDHRRLWGTPDLDETTSAGTLRGGVVHSNRRGFSDKTLSALGASGHQ
jgi:plasmid maintenance system antidote protein VapI